MKQPRKVLSVSMAENLILGLKKEQELREPTEDDDLYDKRKEEYQSKDNVVINEAVTIYNKIILDQKLDTPKRILALISFATSIPSLVPETISRLRDSLPFLREIERNKILDLLDAIAKHPIISSHERCVTAICLYNASELDRCYKDFAAISEDDLADLQYRVEACYYLYGSEMDDFVSISQQTLLKIISDKSIPSSSRYNMIGKLLSPGGVKTFLNTRKLKVERNDQFILSLQRPFFFDQENGPRERILSARYILRMTKSEEETRKIIAELFSISENGKDENTKADALDVIICCGTKDEALKAKELLETLGGGEDMFTSSQNAHDENITEAVHKFVEEAFEELNKSEKGLGKDILVKVYQIAELEMSKLIKVSALPNEQRHSAYKALNRIGLDEATFTSRNLTLSDIFALVWMRIRGHSDENKKTLEKRLLEEFIDMGDTCSSGHSNRLVNVLSAFDVHLGISFESQIKGNINGRMNAILRDIQDEEIKNAVGIAMLADASEEQKLIYSKFIKENLEKVRKELETEFVEGKHLTQDQFTKIFTEQSGKWTM